DILQLLTSSNPTACPLDPIPSALFQTIARDLLPFISVIINNSLSSGYVPTAFKTARVVPILKKATLDSSSVTNYRPRKYILMFRNNWMNNWRLNQRYNQRENQRYNQRDNWRNNQRFLYFSNDDKPLQLVQNAAARLVFDLLKFT
ncbi:hypothetical protein P4O66_022097, partial [Electrophorus voltai]